MTKRLIPTFLLIVCLTGVMSAQIGESADRYLIKRAEMGGFSGAVLMVKNGRTILRKGYGYADVEKRIPYTPETRQPIASITKMFTSMAALILRDRGRLRLEDTICTYIHDCPAAWQPVQIIHLMRNSSGIPDYESHLGLGSEKYLVFMAEPNSSARIVENAKKLPLNFKPGEKFEYSNTGYIVLSYVVQKAAGEAFESFVEKNLLKPAGMKTAGFVGKEDLAVGYTFRDLGWEKTLRGVSLTEGHLKPTPLLPTSRPHGDGSLYAAVDDLYLWSMAMDGSGFVSRKVVEEAFTAGIGGYGFGWFVGKGLDRNRVRHNGALPGYLSNIDKYIDDKITIIMFANIDRARLNSITRDLAAIVLEKPFDMPVQGKVIALTTEQAAKLEGKYKMKDGAVLTIKNEPDYLTASLEGRYTAGLIPIGVTEFYFPLADGRAIFAIGPDGKATSVNMRYSGEDHIAERLN